MVKTKMYKLLSIILCVALTTSLLGTVAFAEEKTYNGYLTVGSSILRGYGFEGYRDHNVSGKMEIEGSASKIVADTLNIPEENRYAACAGGLSSGAIMFMLDMIPDYEGEYDRTIYTSNWKRDLLWRYGTEEQISRLGEAYPKPDDYEVENAKPFVDIVADVDLITLEIGMSDIVYRAVGMSGLTSIGDGDLDIANVISTVIKSLFDGANAIKENYPLILDRIFELNPDTTVTILSMYNPIMNVRIMDTMYVPVGTAFSVITSIMNSEIKSIAAKYEKKGFDVRFVDISNVDTGSSENDMTILNDDFFAVDGGGPSTHPTAAGQKHMAYQIINAITGETENDRNDLMVNMGKTKEATAVIINGIPTKNFETNDGVLTVKGACKLAKTMTVITKSPDEEGKSGVYIYQISYHWGEGFNAYRMYSTNDTKKTITTAVTSFFKTPSAILKLLVG